MNDNPSLAAGDELWLSQISALGWEKAYKTACEQIDAHLAKMSFLEMQLAAVEVRNACLTRENQRLNLTIRHLAPWTSVTPIPSPRSTNTDHEGSDNTLVGEDLELFFGMGDISETDGDPDINNDSETAGDPGIDNRCKVEGDVNMEITSDLEIEQGLGEELPGGVQRPESPSSEVVTFM